MRRYPRFPGVGEYVRLLGLPGTKGTLVDIVCDELAAHAAETLEELIDAFRTNENEWVRLMIVQAIANAKLPAAIPFLAERVVEGPPPVAEYGKMGLQGIGTPEARTALWDAESKIRAAAEIRRHDPAAGRRGGPAK